ncbi:hypothetical protein, partial [Hydrogenimonas sp.]
MRTAYLLSFTLAAGLLFTGCGSGTSDNYSESDSAGGYVVFNSDSGDIPYPNDILYNPVERHIALPIAPDDSNGTKALKAQLNTLDGFSTVAPITISVSDPVDPASLLNPANVHLYKVQALFVPDKNATVVLGVDQELVNDPASGDYVAAYSAGKIALLPRKPLEPESYYMVLLTKGIKGVDGRSLEPDYVGSLTLRTESLLDENGDPILSLDPDPVKNEEKVRALEGLRQLNLNMIQAAGIAPEEVLAVWKFKTQSIGKVAEAFAANNPSGASLYFVDTKFTSKDVLMAANPDQADEINATMKGNAEVYVGVLKDLPYYLGIPDNNQSETPLRYFFQFNGSDLPVQTGTVDIPVLATVPLADYCKLYEDNWPVVIFQHGVTRNRLDVLTISEALATACYAAVAIDLPLHGIADPDNTFYKLGRQLGAQERTFDLDRLTQDADETILAYKPDGKIDTSGIHYMNLQSLVTARDNIRQSTSDYLALYNALVDADKTNNGLGFNDNNISYVGHSLGAMAPFGYFATQNVAGQRTNAVVLACEGGGIAELLMHSQTFGDTIRKGLENIAGIEPYSSAYYQFVNATQTILDDADPVNYAKKAAQAQRMLSFEVLNDDVVPNYVKTAPLSGQEPLLALMQAKDVLSYPITGENARLTLETQNTVTRFQRGNHRSLLTPVYDPVVTVEMQTQMASFIASGGNAVDINTSR